MLRKATWPEVGRAVSATVLLVATTALFGAGCGFDGQLGEVACDTNGDCPESATCIDGYCVHQEPDQSEPDQNQPDQNQPDQNQPDQNQPDQNQPDQNQPDQNQPDQNDDECLSHETSCGEDCVDLDADPAHCGACHNACDEGSPGSEATCDDGQCVYDCPGDETFCSADEATGDEAICTVVDDDFANCGECGNECGELQNGDVDCHQGECTFDCDDGYTLCDETCVDLDENAQHCGECNASCDATQDCSQGGCLGPDDCDPGDAPFGGGDGTAGDPHRICTADHLQNIDASPDHLEDHFRLDDHIDLAGVDFAPIARGYVEDGWIEDTFRGFFDGNGYEIIGLTVETDESRSGLFGTVGEQGEVYDVTLVDASISGSYRTGAVAGLAGGVLRQVHVVGDETSVEGGARVGGVAGEAREMLDGVSFRGAVVGDDDIGAISGRSLGDIDDAFAEGSVVGNEHVGGLAGISAGDITDSTADVDVEGTNRVGGLTGQQFGAVTDSEATGSVVGSEQVGGLIGRVGSSNDYSGPIVSSRATGDVEGAVHRIGGLIGDTYGAVDRCVATGAINADQPQGNEVGGLIGRARAVISVTDSYATGDVAGHNAVGGLIGQTRDVGFSTETSVVRTHASGEVSVPDWSFDYGGLIANNWSGAPYANVVDSYWNLDASGIDESDGGEGLTNDRFTSQTDYEDYFDGFDFDDIWEMGPSHPVLQWEE